MGWRKAVCSCCFLAASLPLFGQGTSFPVFNRQGWTMAGAVVATCNGPADPGTGHLYCLSPVTTYTDWTLITPCTQVTSWPNPPGPPLGPTWGTGCTNPGQTDSHGNATIFAANGFYWAIISGYQVVPQTFPFSIGTGGGGSGVTSFSSGNLPPAFTTAVSNPTTTPALSFIWSNWLADGFLLNATASPAPPTIQTIPACAADGTHALTYPSHTLTCTTVTGGGGGGAISEEYLYPIFSTNSPFPMTTTDQTKSLFQQGQDKFFAGPLPPTNPLSTIIQDKVCDFQESGGGGAIDVSCTFDTPTIPGDSYYGVAGGEQGLGNYPTFTMPADSNGNTPTILLQNNGSGLVPPAVNFFVNNAATSATPTTVTVHLSLSGGSGHDMLIHIMEIAGTVSTAVDDAQQSAASSSPPITFHSVTTVTPPTWLVATVIGQNNANSYTPGSGWTAVIPNNNVNGAQGSIFTEAQIQTGTGTYTPTATATVGGQYTTFTTAFKNATLGGPGKPVFRLIRYTADLTASDDFPTLGGNSGKCLGVDPTETKIVPIACGSGGGFITGTGTTGFIPKWTSATAQGNSAADDGITTANTLTYAGTGGITASAGPIQSQSDGTHAGKLGLVGNTTAPTLAANTFNFLGPNSAAFTSYAWQSPTAENSTAGMLYFGAAAGHISAMSFISQSGAKCYPFMGTGGTGCDTPSGGATSFSALTSGTNTTAAMVVGTGSCMAWTGSATLDMSADTAAAAFKVPVGAGFTSSADGVINYDSTAKITHVRTNGADSDVAATTGTSTTTTNVLHATAVASIYSASAIVTGDLPTAAVTRTACMTDIAPVTGDDNLITLINPATAVHITRFSCGVTGTTSVVGNLTKASAALIADATCTAGDANQVVVTSFVNGSGQCGGTSSCAVAAHAPVTVHLGTISGTPTGFTVCVDYTVD